MYRPFCNTLTTNVCLIAKCSSIWPGVHSVPQTYCICITGQFGVHVYHRSMQINSTCHNIIKVHNEYGGAVAEPTTLIVLNFNITQFDDLSQNAL